jgi:hypothetical protein
MEMKKRILPLMIFVLLGTFLSGSTGVKAEPHSPWACTSFAVYNGSPLYGMNFDYPDVPIRFTIQEFGDLKVFQMEFKDEGGFIPTVGMNSSGLFASSQMLFPELPSTPRSDEKHITIWGLYQDGLYRHQTVAEILTLAEEYQIVNSGLTLHDLFADPSGEAVVVEVIGEQEKLTPISGQYIVMTNFPVSSIQGTPISEIEGVGADRYQITDRIIRENLDDFQVNTGFQILEEASLAGDFSTQASMVFDPVTQEVYIALDRDFNKIWIVSLAENKIRTWRGFVGQGTLPLDHQGITEEEMLEMGLSITLGQAQIQYLLLPIALFSILILIVWSIRRFSTKKE